MNVKPGDIAMVVHPKGWGRIVSVLHSAAGDEIRLPDGMRAYGSETGWVVESLGQDFEAYVGHSGRSRNCRFGVLDDKWLRPIRPEHEPESVTTEDTVSA
jgi:hypothetical protein